MLKSFLKTATLRQSLITSSGTIINGGLGALFYIILARILGPADFGILTVSIATLTLIADIADLGTNTGIVRFVSASLSEHSSSDAYRFLKLSLLIKLLVWIVVFGVGYFVAPLVALNFYGKPELVLPLRLVFFGVLGAMLFSFATSSLQAFQKFKEWSYLNVLTNFLRLMAILFLIYFAALNQISSLTIYIILPFFGFFIALLILPTKKILSAKKEFSLWKDLAKYNTRVSLFVLVAAISSRLDTFLVAKFLKTAEVGIYGAATQLTAVIPQLVAALGVVVAPKFASFTNLKDMLAYFKKIQVMVLVVAFVILLVLPSSYILVPFFLGHDYINAVEVFIILAVANLIFLISVPTHNSIFYFFSRPDLFIWISIGHLLIIGIMGYLLIINFGLLGAALTVLVGMLFNFLAPLVWVLAKIKK